MISQKSQLRNPTGGVKQELKFLVVFLGLISFSNLIFSNNTSALFTPTLSASVDNSAVSVNGNQVINSVLQTSELPIRVTVNTNNKTGYTATLNTETDETALVNSDSMSGAKIDSIDTSKSLTNFSQNTWGFLSPSSGNYQPIPSLSNSANLFSTTAKTSGNENFDFKIGMKLADNLESGNYTNKLVISVISNPYERRAVMTNGLDFNARVGNLDPNPAIYPDPIYPMPTKPSIKAFKRSTIAPTNLVSAINIEDPDTSDYEIKAWYSAADQAVYYYAAPNVVFLNENSMGMFMWFTKMETIDLASFDTSEVTTMNTMFYMMDSLKSIDVSKFNTSKVTDMFEMFDNVGIIEQLNVSSFNTSNVTNMKWMFFGLSKVKKLDLTNFNTSMVTDMYGMFDSMSDVKEIKFGPSFDTSSVTDMGMMFARLDYIQRLDLSTFNTQKVINMGRMFMAAKSIQNLDLSSFDTSNVTDMNAMFSSMYSIKSLDISNFNTQKVTDMNNMFSEMLELVTLDISNFNTKNVTNFESMFAIDESHSVIGGRLERIYVNNDFDLTSATNTSGLFKFQTRLRGGLGSFDGNTRYANYSWLRIDRPGAKGYFTRKP